MALMWHTGRHTFLHPWMTLSFIVWTGSLLLRLHYSHTINFSSSFSPAALVTVKMIIREEERLGQRNEIEGQGKKTLSSCTTEKRYRWSKCGSWMRNPIMTHTPTLMCIVIWSRLKVLHNKWSFQMNRSAFKPFVELEAKGVKFTPLNSAHKTSNNLGNISWL